MRLYSESCLDLVVVFGWGAEHSRGGRRYPQCGNKSFVCSMSCVVGLVIYSSSFFLVCFFFLFAFGRFFFSSHFFRWLPFFVRIEP